MSTCRLCGLVHHGPWCPRVDSSGLGLRSKKVDIAKFCLKKLGLENKKREIAPGIYIPSVIKLKSQAVSNATRAVSNAVSNLVSNPVSNRARFRRWVSRNQEFYRLKQRQIMRVRRAKAKAKAGLMQAKLGSTQNPVHDY